VVDALQWLAEQGRCSIFGFVIMPNHVHLLWKIADGFIRSEVQGALLSYTAHQFKEHLKSNNPEILHYYYVCDADRKYQFWERDSLVKECWSESFLIQKLDYLHHNPCQPHWKLSPLPEDYSWSSATFYQTGKKNFSFLTHYKE
jgi:REP element-mobilizing transposase RayT